MKKNLVVPAIGIVVVLLSTMSLLDRIYADDFRAIPLKQSLNDVQPFGLFDNSFNHAKHEKEHEPNWNILGRDRWKLSPTGGEFRFFRKVDQSEALAPTGPQPMSCCRRDGQGSAC